MANPARGAPPREGSSDRGSGLSLLFVGGGALAAAPWVHRISEEFPGGVRLCLLNAATGIPCPLCGGTRAAASLATGAPLEALAWNPLVTVAIAAGVISGAALLLGWKPPDAVRRLLNGRVALAALALNWAWLIAAGR